MPELNYEMKNLDSMWTRIAASNKIEIVCAVLEDEIIALKKQTSSDNLSALITICLLDKSDAADDHLSVESDAPRIVIIT